MKRPRTSRNRTAITAILAIASIASIGVVQTSGAAPTPLGGAGGSATLRVVPNAALIDRQRIEVRGEGFAPYADMQVAECAGTSYDADRCSVLDRYAQSNDTGDVRVRIAVRRILRVAAATYDCARVECAIVVPDNHIDTALPLSFYRRGPRIASEFFPQLECARWPTTRWVSGALPDGVDPDAVAALGEQLVGAAQGRSIVVIHGGRVVYERYAPGYDANTIFTSASVSKSFASTIIGLLEQQGRLALDDRAPIRKWSGRDDPRRVISLRNILNMSSGLDWNENYYDPDGDVLKMIVSPDNAAYVIAKPLAWQPGSRWRYSTGDTAVLGRIIKNTARVSGRSYKRYLHDVLFDPLGISPVRPAFDQSGTWMAGIATNTTTRNFAKLGLLYLRHGAWEDHQFLSQHWVDFVRTPSLASDGYGGQFWLNPDGSFEMLGLGGQHVQIVPALDLIVAMNDGYGNSQMVDLFRNAIRPACGVIPTAVDDVAADATLAIDVLGNDTRGELGLAPYSLTVSSLASHGTATVEGRQIRYTPDAGYTGTDHFDYAVCTLSDRDRCIEATVTVTVT